MSEFLLWIRIKEEMISRCWERHFLNIWVQTKVFWVCIALLVHTVANTKLLVESFSIVVWQVNNVQLQVGLRKTGALPALLYTSFLAWLMKLSCRRCNIWTAKDLDYVWKYRSVNDVEVGYVDLRHTPRCRLWVEYLLLAFQKLFLSWIQFVSIWLI